MIVIINPNSTVSMTEAMLETARAAVSSGVSSAMPKTQILGWTSHEGCPSIQGPEDGAASTPPLLRLVKKASDSGASAIIIGCADDTGLTEARQIAACPVIGIGQAAYHLAALAGERFSVVTTLAVSVPILEQNIGSYGLAGQLARVRASGVPVLDLERAREAAQAKVMAEIERAVAEDGVSSVVLGCAGMVSIPAAFGADKPVRLIDGVTAAVRIATILP